MSNKGKSTINKKCETNIEKKYKREKIKKLPTNT